jgi:hypothetical protein
VPQNAAATSSNYSKAGPRGRMAMAVHEANASNREEAAQKKLASCRRRFSVAEEKTAMEADDRRASVGG